MMTHAEYRFIRHQDIFQNRLFQMFHVEVNDLQNSTYNSVFLVWLGCVRSFRLEIHGADLRADSRHVVDNEFTDLADFIQTGLMANE
jgi:hypothetical protein